MNKNYGKELEKILCKPETMGKRLLLHSCCAPCSSYCLEYLRPFFRITVFYYNPNISLAEEYQKRKAEQQRLIGEMNESAATEGGFLIDYRESDYEPERFLIAAKGLESCAEGGERCFRCYELRLRKSAEEARAQGMDFFTTTLTISPLKNAATLNQIGEQVGAAAGVKFLPADFKKKGGYGRSVELSRQYGLYRQDYCGCIYSRR